MDRLESLGNALSQITMYDIKSMYNQVSCEQCALTADGFLTVLRPRT